MKPADITAMESAIPASALYDALSVMQTVASATLAETDTSIEEWISTYAVPSSNVGVSFCWSSQSEGSTLASIQLCVGPRGCVFPLQYPSLDEFPTLPSGLLELLQSANCLKIFCGLSAGTLRKIIPMGITLAHFVDVGDIERKVNREANKKDLKTICLEYLGGFLLPVDESVERCQTYGSSYITDLAFLPMVAVKIFESFGERFQGMVKKAAMPCPDQSCERYFASHKSLDHHRQIHHHDPDLPSIHPYRCPCCVKFFRLPTSLVQHIEVAHADCAAGLLAGLHTSPELEQKMLQMEQTLCAECNAVCNSDRALQTHQQKTGHSGIRYCCKQCNKIFTARSALKMHVDVTHVQSKSTSYVCYTCGAVFTSLDSLHQHQQCVGHSLAEMCNVCYASFQTKDELENHFKSTNHHTYWLCAMCSKKFSEKDALAKHEQSTGHVGGCQARDASKDFIVERSKRVTTHKKDKIAVDKAKVPHEILPKSNRTTAATPPLPAAPARVSPAPTISGRISNQQVHLLFQSQSARASPPIPPAAPRQPGTYSAPSAAAPFSSRRPNSHFNSETAAAAAAGAFGAPGQFGFGHHHFHNGSEFENFHSHDFHNCGSEYSNDFHSTPNSHFTGVFDVQFGAFGKGFMQGMEYQHFDSESLGFRGYNHQFGVDTFNHPQEADYSCEHMGMMPYSDFEELCAQQNQSLFAGEPSHDSTFTPGQHQHSPAAAEMEAIVKHAAKDHAPFSTSICSTPERKIFPTFNASKDEEYQVTPLTPAQKRSPLRYTHPASPSPTVLAQAWKRATCVSPPPAKNGREWTSPSVIIGHMCNRQATREA